MSRIALGDLAGAGADARRGASAYEEIPSLDTDESFEWSCCYALLAGWAGKEGSGVSDAEGQAAADEAMALLRKTDDNGCRWVRFRTVPSLEPLRKREDFQKLLKVEQKAPDKPK
jgi:hypothetical protein